MLLNENDSMKLSIGIFAFFTLFAVSIVSARATEVEEVPGCWTLSREEISDPSLTYNKPPVPQEFCIQEIKLIRSPNGAYTLRLDGDRFVQSRVFDPQVPNEGGRKLKFSVKIATIDNVPSFSETGGYKNRRPGVVLYGSPSERSATYLEVQLEKNDRDQIASVNFFLHVAGTKFPAENDHRLNPLPYGFKKYFHYIRK